MGVLILGGENEKRGERHRGWWRSPLERIVTRCRGCLGRTTTAGSEFANVVEEDGALQVVELRGIHRDLGEEGIGHEDRGLVAMARVGVSQKGGDIDLKGPGESVK